MKRLLIISFTCLVSISFALSDIAPAAALAFDKNNVMNDQVFDNYKSMSQTDVKNFIESQPSTCLTGWTTPDPQDYFNYGSNVAPYKAIYDVSQIWKVNPQVILSTIQKESSLVTGGTDSYGNNICDQNWRYTSAMGYDCPDSGGRYDYPDIGVTGTCVAHEGNAGFARQVNHGSWQLKFNKERAYGNLAWDGDGDVYNYGYMTKGWRKRCNSCDNIYYDGYATIDGDSTVYMTNGATASLYTYTPHFSGNQHFYTIFTNWFGPTRLKDNYRFEKLAAPSGAVNKVNSTDLGDYTKTLTVGDKIYVFYYDAVNKNLRLSLWDGSSWQNRILDGAGASTPGATTHDVGKYVSATVWNGDMQVYYYDATNGDLRHAWLPHDQWLAETMDGSKGSLAGNDRDMGKFSMVTIWHKQLQLYYYDATAGNLRHAWWPGDGRWHFETMDGSTGSLGGLDADVGSSGVAMVWYDQLQLYYYDATNGNLRHAWWPGDGKWHFETMDGSTSSLGKFNGDLGRAVAATLYNGRLQIYYYDAVNGNLRHAWWPGDNRWHFETMDGSTRSVIGGDIDAGSKIAVKQFQKDLFLFYYDKTNNDWRMTYWADNTWNAYTLDGAVGSISGSSNPVGGQLSVGILNDRSLQIFYQNSGALEHAWATR